MRLLSQHFPTAFILTRSRQDDVVESVLASRGERRSLLYRKRNVSTLKVFDFFLLSQADTIITIDPDIVFFGKPAELLQTRPSKNLFNRDGQYAYSMRFEEIAATFCISPPPLINSGLSLVARESMDFARINGWLESDKLFRNTWLTEQTLHALSSTVHGVDFLPSTYAVSGGPGLRSDLVCKHYPGSFRKLLYSEGMRHLAEETTFLQEIAQRVVAVSQR